MADKKTFKVTKGMTRDYLIEVLSKNQPAMLMVVDPKATKDLPARVETAIANRDDKKAVTRNSLGNLCKEVCDVLGDNFIEVPVPPKTENAVKKTTEGKKTTKTTSVTTAPIEMAGVFPESLQAEDEGGNTRTFTIDHEVKTIEDLRKGLDSGKLYVFAFWWTKRHLRQFVYQWCNTPKNPESFPNDLDTAQVFLVGDRHPVAYCVSDQTEGLYTVYERDLEEVDGVRFCNGIDFQIYSTTVPAKTTEAPANGQ